MPRQLLSRDLHNMGINQFMFTSMVRGKRQPPDSQRPPGGTSRTRKSKTKLFGALQTRIKGIAQAVTEEGEGQHHQGHADGRGQQHPGLGIDR